MKRYWQNKKGMQISGYCCTIDVTHVLICLCMSHTHHCYDSTTIAFAVNETRHLEHKLIIKHAAATMSQWTESSFAFVKLGTCRSGFARADRVNVVMI